VLEQRWWRGIGSHQGQVDAVTSSPASVAAMPKVVEEQASLKKLASACNLSVAIVRVYAEVASIGSGRD
jgi:hypothetical protein